MSNNLVRDWAEFGKLADLPCLVELVFVGKFERFDLKQISIDVLFR